MGDSSDSDRGQATLEMVLVLPLLCLLLAAFVEIGMIVADQSRVWHAAREGARVAAVTGERDEIVEAVEATGIEGGEISIVPEAAIRRQGDAATVSVGYRPGGRIPLVGSVFSGIVLEGSATMRIERP